jgi:hypothetical protein
MLDCISAVNLVCEYDTSSAYGVSGKYCDVKNLVLSWPDDAITNVDGRTDQVLNDIKLFIISNHPNLIYLPKGIATFFPKIEWLQMHFTGLKKITKEDLKPFPHLKIFWFHNNQIDGDLFQFNPKLTHIFLNSNKTKHVGANLLNSLKNLEEAEFSSNFCINKEAENKNKIPELIRESEENANHQQRQQCVQQLKAHEKLN